MPLLDAGEEVRTGIEVNAAANVLPATRLATSKYTLTTSADVRSRKGRPPGQVQQVVHAGTGVAVSRAFGRGELHRQVQAAAGVDARGGEDARAVAGVTSPAPLIAGTVPDPPRVAPDATLTPLLLAIEPFTSSLPPLTVVAPVYPFVPARIIVPPPLLINGCSP